MKSANISNTRLRLVYSCISQESISKFDVLYPKKTSYKPSEQEKIANCLSSLDELIEATSRKVEILKEHKKGLMQQLFPKI